MTFRSPNLLRQRWDSDNLNGLAATFNDMQGSARPRIPAEEFRVPPNSVFDIFPGKQGVVARRDTFKPESAGIVGDGGLIEIVALAMRGIGNEDDLHAGIRFAFAVDHGAHHAPCISSQHDLQAIPGALIDLNAAVECIDGPKRSRLQIEAWR